jgi:DNA primase
MGIPDSIVEDIRQRADLVEMVSEHTTLKRSGKTFRGPCPLHGGNGPNFSVDPAKNIFKCFVCNEGGDVFSFPMKMLGMTFLDAVRHVGERVGVEVPEDNRHDAEPDPHASLYEANAYAADWFQRQLRNDSAGREVREYLAGRGISENAIERFGLGWAPEAWSELGDAARAQGISNEILLSLGLVKESTKVRREPYDAFRGRLIFPIEDLGGRVIGFGGRIIGEVEEHTPKYLNSPETPIYHKGEVLYGLGWSRGAIRKAEAALVVEGYMDYVALASHGVENVVAPLGTALTIRQAELIARYAKRAILLYDSDMAGLRATFRSGDELLRAGVEVLVASLPDGEDPDSLVRSGGAPGLRPYLKDAVDVLERKIQILERSGRFSSIADIRRSVDSLLPTVRATSDEVLRGVYIARIAEKTGVARETLEREVAQAVAADERAQVSAERGRRDRERSRDDARSTGMSRTLGPERNLMLLLLRDDAWLEQAASRISSSDFRDPVYGAIFGELVHMLPDGGRDREGRWIEGLEPAEAERVQELMGDREAGHIDAPAMFFEGNLRAMLARPYEERLARVQAEIASAEPARQLVLQQELVAIRNEMREHDLLGIKRYGVFRDTTAPEPR